MSNPTDTNQASEVLQGDCLELMKDIPDGSVDMILADLPYGTTACKWDTIIPFEPLWEHYKRIIKPNGAIVLFGNEPFSSHLRMSNINQYKYDWVWNKRRVSNPSMAKRQPLRCVENIMVFGGGSYYPQGLEKCTKKMGGNKRGASGLSTAQKRDDYVQEFTNYPKNLLEFSADNYGKNCFHPTQKPVALFEYLIKTYTNEGDLVLDNVAGSGTTGVACQNTNRNFILMEQEPEYVEIIKKRLELNKERRNDQRTELTKLEAEL